MLCWRLLPTDLAFLAVISNNCSMNPSTPPLALTDRELQLGVTYAIRPETGMQLEPAMFLGQTLYEFPPGDSRNYRRRAYAQLDRDGWWRPVWAGGPPKMRREDFVALPEAERPL
jgi:hypothetical protein